MIIPTTANSFDELNNAYVSSVSQLPVIDESRLRPDKVEQSLGHIRGWIDIVGFREMAKVNGSDTNYINGNPVDKAIIRYDTWGVDSACGYKITTTIQKYASGINIVGVMNVELVWYSIECDDDSCWCATHTDRALFYDSEPSPIQYPNSSIPYLILHKFSNSNKALLEVNTDEKITSFKVTTDNGSMTRHIQVGQVVYTTKGVPYANFTKNLPVWNSTGKGVYHQGNDITLDSSNFSFSAMTPFDTRNATNITIIKEQPTSMSVLNVLIFIMLGMGYIACKLAWRITKI